MTGWIWRLTLFSAATATLAGCSGSHNGGGGNVVVTPPFACQFGAQFCVDFAAAANSEPAATASTDIVPLTLTAEPVALH